MATKKLTPRQIETIRHIHDYMSRNGLPPTIDDLRRLMGVASDQGVIEILQRLEDRGIVERTSGQARGLRLTAEAYLAIGVAPAQSAVGSSGLPQGAPRPFELSPLQQRIFKRLADIDPKLARMYEGGLRVLLDDTNPERVALSAHSIRESTHHLSNMGKGLLSKEEEKAAKDLKASNARQLEKVFDPLGGVSGFGPTLYDTWNEFQTFFVNVSHHRLGVALEEYREKLSQFENLLSRYVLPLQVEIYALLDEQLDKGPENADTDQLRALLSRNVESYRYFFRKADVRWLGYLNQHKLISPRWEVADYLARIAPEASVDVMAIAETLNTDKNDWATRKGLIDAAAKMSPITARRILDKIDREQWLAEPYVDWLVYSLDPLIGIFIANSQHADASRLISLLAQRPDGQPKVKSYHFETILKHISAVRSSELPPYIRILVASLVTARSGEHPGASDDLSFMWRPAIEDNEQNWRHGDPRDLLITAVRDALVRYVEHLHMNGRTDTPAIVDDLLKSEAPHSILTRLGLHLYREKASQFMPQIESAVTKHFDTTDVWHEYFLLLAKVFPQLSKATQARYFEMVDRGPTRMPKGEPDERYVERWKARKLSPILEHLSPAQVERYGAAVAEARIMAHPDLLSYHSGGWVSSTSPVSEAELAGMSMDSLLDLIASWEPPPNDIFVSSSHADLALALSKVVGKNPEVFSREAHRFNDARLRSDFLYHLFSGFHEALRNKAQLQWQGIIILAGAIIERARSGVLPVFETTPGNNSWVAEWNGVFQEIGSLIEDGLRDSSLGPEFALRGDIWGIIEFLCDHKDPSIEHEKTGSTSDLANLSLNTLHGRAFRALFAYIFWCDRHLKSKGENGSRIPLEAEGVLERHLDPTYDPGLTVRSVCGEFFGWLFVYDPSWTAKLIHRVFPLDDPDRRYAAWETYLANGLRPQLYKALKPQYEQAISEIRNFKPARRFWADPIEGLAVHMMVAYAYREDEENGATWLKFFRVASPKQRGKAVSFGGTAFVHRGAARAGEQLPDTNRLQQFWEWRLKESKDTEELKEFGWWVREGNFNDEWVLQRLIDTLVKTDGDVAMDFQVLDALLVLAPRHPLLCAKALSLMVRSRSADRLMLGHNEDIPRILEALYSTEDAEATSVAENVIDHLTKLGFETYRTISQAQRKPLGTQEERLIAEGGRQ